MNCSAHQHTRQTGLLLFFLAIGAFSESIQGRRQFEPGRGTDEESTWKQRTQRDIDCGDAPTGDEAALGCTITDKELVLSFTKVSQKVNLVDDDGDLCGANNTMEERQPSTVANQSLTCSSCDSIYDFVQRILIDLNVTTPCCLGNGSACGNGTDIGRTATVKAYGYGFLMVLAVSLLSLLGVIILPALNRNSGVYLYCNTLLIAMGTSALFCSAILNLLPKALNLDDSEKKAFIWRGMVIISGLYLLYLFEVTLHSFSDHTHSHNNMLSDSHHEGTTSHHPQTTRNGSTGRPDFSSINGETGGEFAGEKGEPVPQLEEQTEELPLIIKSKSSFRCCGIKPFAWTILLGDAFHNFADGLTVGAAISHSLSLGLSTTVAIAFHEIPHELGDFAILLSTGLPWYVALALNFLSSLTAIIGFFVGVTIGTNSVESNNWILTAAVGLFLYVALVDLLPELIHINQKGCKRLCLILMANIGFFISLAVLLPIAVYEDKFDKLIS